MLPRQSKILDTDDTDDTDKNGQKSVGAACVYPCPNSLIGWRRRFAGQFRRQNGISGDGAQGRCGRFAAFAPPHAMGTPTCDGHPRPQEPGNAQA
jgi:hypothetical protein